MDVSGPAAAPIGVAPPERADRKPRPWLALVAAVVLLLLGAGLLWFLARRIPGRCGAGQGRHRDRTGVGQRIRWCGRE
jgi:drug/metabolite transporter (DMT)-like permease